MKRHAHILAALFSLLLAGYSLPSFAAPGPDSFAGVPWGTDPEQVDNAMKEKGFTSLDGNPPAQGDIRRTYQGTFAGYEGSLSFSFLQNTFYQGEFVAGETRDNNLMGIWGQQLLGMLSEKYGPSPRRVEGERGDYELYWEGLPVQGSSDHIDLILWVHFWDGNEASTKAKVSLRYTNKSLEQRLNARQQQKGKSDL